MDSRKLNIGNHDLFALIVINYDKVIKNNFKHINSILIDINKRIDNIEFLIKKYE